MNRTFTCIIIDDEKLAREDLKSLLGAFNEIEIIGEADGYNSAIQLLNQHKPDVIFLDIQMPGKNGFELLKEIRTNARIIFVTAYDEFAIKAFEVSAQDYLLKPVNRGRLELAISRLTEKNMPNGRTDSLIDYNETLFIMVNNTYQFVKISDIIKIFAAGNYSEIHTKEKQKGLVLKSLREWENRLPSNQFVRIHRNTIINLEYVNKIENWFNYSHKIYLKHSDETVIMSRRYTLKLKDLLS